MKEPLSHIVCYSGGNGQIFKKKEGETHISQKRKDKKFTSARSYNSGYKVSFASSLHPNFLPLCSRKLLIAANVMFNARLKSLLSSAIRGLGKDGDVSK